MPQHNTDTSPPVDPPTAEDEVAAPPVTAEAETVPETPKKPATTSAHGFKHRLTSCAKRYWSHKKWSLPATAIIVLLVVLAIPASRYAVLGLVLKEPVQLAVMDSTTHTPVSGARLQFGHVTALTSAKGKASLRLPVGYSTLAVSKQYYKSTSSKMLVSYSKARNTIQVRLVATGRQVPVTVINKVTGKPVANAEIKVLDTEAKTDKAGHAIIVLPVNKSSQSGTVTAGGYNKTSVKVQVTAMAVVTNTYSVTPAGTVYFLSNLSGKIDAVRTNLDGTDRQTVLKGTGNESPTGTVLLASRDWKYLALLVQRKPTGNPELDLIDTSTDTMSNIDEGDATFTPIGWDDDRFVYQVNRNAIAQWQNGEVALKSFNAPTKTLTMLAQSTGSGSSVNSTWQSLGGTYIVNNKVFYTSTWHEYNPIDWNNTAIAGKQDTLNTVNSDGSQHAVVKSFTIGTDTVFNLAVNPYDGPNSLSIQYSQGALSSYYAYQNGQVTPSTDITDQNFYNNNNPTYLLSPSGNQTFWSEPTDGKNTLLVGDENGANGKKVATLSDYSPYGWYTDSYLLVSKNGSQLYIMPASGGTPVPVADYFKPSQFFLGYGGGYGGI